MHTDRKASHTKRARVPRPGDVLGPQDHLATSPAPRPSLCLSERLTSMCVSHWLVWQQNPTPPHRGSLQTEKILDPTPTPTLAANILLLLLLLLSRFSRV